MQDIIEDIRIFIEKTISQSTTSTAPLAALQETPTWEPIKVKASPSRGLRSRPGGGGLCGAKLGGVVPEQSSRRLRRHPPLHKEGLVASPVKDLLRKSRGGVSAADGGVVSAAYDVSSKSFHYPASVNFHILCRIWLKQRIIHGKISAVLI